MPHRADTMCDASGICEKHGGYFLSRHLGKELCLLLLLLLLFLPIINLAVEGARRRNLIGQQTLEVGRYFAWHSDERPLLYTP